MLGGAAARAAQSLRPAGPALRVGARRLGAEAGREFGDRHAGLEVEVEVVDGQGWRRDRMQPACGPSGSKNELAASDFQSGQSGRPVPLL